MTRPKRPTDRTQPDPFGARWCPEHEWWECTRQRSKGRGVCHGNAIDGTAACRMHSGVPSDVAKAQGLARITAFSALGGVPQVDPGYAVLASLHLSWLRLHLYASLLEQQVEEDAAEREAQSPSFTDGAADLQVTPEGVRGLIGHTYAADKMAGIFASGEAVRALVGLEAQERDRVVKFAKVAHDMGIAEREVKLAESQGQLLATVVRNILGDLALTPEQQGMAAGVIQRRLREAAVAGELEQGSVA